MQEHRPQSGTPVSPGHDRIVRQACCMSDVPMIVLPFCSTDGHTATGASASGTFVKKHHVSRIHALSDAASKFLLYITSGPQHLWLMRCLPITFEKDEQLFCWLQGCFDSGRVLRMSQLNACVVAIGAGKGHEPAAHASFSRKRGP
jgi:hypothetical protein